MGHFVAPADHLTVPRRFDSIQGLRAWAMVLVFSFHLHHFIQGLWPNPFSEALLACGGLGANLFLCIAGCFLYRSLSERPAPYLEFLARRFWRLYPVYAFMLVIYLAVDLTLKTGRLGLRGDATDLVLLASNFLLLPVFLGETPMMDVSWTLAYIAAFTLVAPPLVRMMKGWSKPARLYLLWALWMGSWMLCARTSLLPPRVTLLLGGVLAWELLSSRVTWASVAFLALPGLILGQPARIALMPAVLLVVLNGVPWLDRILQMRAFQLLGSRGYSFYLAHGLPLLALQQFVLPALNLPLALALQPVCLALSLGFAECVYRLVEMPCQQARHSTPIPALPVRV
jgi:peptidoglycan/LPS O-acetylase OafA/YrhL